MTGVTEERRGKKEVKVRIRLYLDYDFITTTDLERILAEIRPYWRDPLRIEIAKLKSGWIEIIALILAPIVINEAIRYLREKLGKPSKEGIEEIIKRRRNLRIVSAEFKIEEGEGKLIWKVPQD